MFKKLILKNLIIFVCLITAVLTVGHFTLAQSSDNLLFGGLQNETGDIIGLGDEDPRIIIANIIRVALGFLGIVAVGLIIYAGWIWMTADGNAENIEKAKKILTGAVIGLVIILLSFAIASYILGKLLDATGGGGGGEACANEGEKRNCGCGGIQTCSGGVWGQCIGSSCGSGPAPFYITSTLPYNGKPNEIRNAKIRFTFYSSVDPGTVSLGAGGTFKVTDSNGAEIPGSQSTSGRRITFTPDGECGENPCGATNCFPGNEAITVEAINGATGILGASGQELDCTSFGVLPCKITFNTGALIDCEDPAVKFDLNLDQVCVVSDNKLYANSSDDSGIDNIEFFVDNSAVADNPFGNNPIVNINGDSPFNTRGESLPSIWDGSSYTVGESVNIKAIAYDIDDHSASDIKDIALRAEHCCNETKDADEDGEDCGGADCASCEGAPIIDWVAPEGGFCDDDPNTFCKSDSDCGTTCNKNTPNGAVGNLITIGGRYFGDTPGTVELSDDNGASWTSAVLGGCAGSWQNDQIIVQVPSLSNGAGKIIKINTNNNFEDATNDDRGPIIDFTVNNIERPGVCSISPDKGIMNQKINYSDGLRLSGVSAFFGNSSNSIAALNSSFAADDTGAADVPNIPTGKTTTFVKNNLEVPSNYLRFTKEAEPKTGPQITSFSPVKGKEGQYITIYGSGFGSANKDQVGNSHNVYFDLDLSDNTEAALYGEEADFDFPEICSDDLWKDNQIIVKVPALSNDDYFIVIDADSWSAPISTGGLTPNETFEYDNNLPLLPSLCKIAPAMGPNNSDVSLWGEYFGAGATAQVKFQLNKFQGPPLTISQNGGADRVNTKVPASAISGPVSVMQGSDEGNGLNFSVGNCSNENDCGGTVCCPAGSFRAGMCAVDDTGLGGNGDLITDINDCYADIGSSVYEWDFNTGSGGNIGDPCKIDPQTGACDINNSGCSPSLICDSSDCTCQPAGTCAGYSMNECTENKFCPNSPGACQALNETITANACDNNYCNSEYPQCAGACSYNINKNSCVSASTCNGENTSLVSGYTAICEKVSGTNGKWQINTNGASCPAGTFLDTNGRCTVGTVGNPTACSVCVDGLSCSDEQCIVNEKICADGFNCNAGVCEKGKDSCECCCRVAEEDADCCLGLTCTPNLCDPGNADYGQCTGCTIEVNGASDQTLSDAACNCDGVTNKVCNINFDADSDGIKEGKCEDALAPGASCDSDPSTPECTPDGSCEKGLFCDGNNGCVCNSIVVGTDCDDNPITNECNIIPNFCESVGLTCDPDGGDDVVGNTDDCTCQQSGNDVGESCDDVDNPPACNPNACISGLSCMTETWPPAPGNCGNCCCSVGAGDNCNLINPNLVCNYAEDAGGCFDNNKGVAPDFGLCCGCSSDGQCGGDISATGCGSDTCCRPRPEIVPPTVPANNAQNVCRNAAIEVTFDKKMDIKSFSGNVVVVGDYGFGVCPEGTQYILSQNENKGFFAKLFSLPLRFVKKIFYLLNPEARALTVNFCAIPGKVSGRQNVDETTTLTFTPDGLLDGNRKYYAIIKGDSNIGDNTDEGVKNIYGVSMVDVWPDIDGSGLSESDRTFNGTVYYGYAWSFKTMSALSANNGVCKIDHVIVSPDSYLFNTTEDDVKENDADSESPDFDKKQDQDKVFSAAAVSADGQILSKIPDVYIWNWEWKSEPNMVVNFDSENPFAAIDAKQLFAAQTGITDGKAVITATANVSGSMAGASEFYSAEADVWVFVCENPWPAVDSATGLWAPWTDAQANCGAFAGGQCPNTNYNIYYCRDAAGVGTVDDLPAILSKNTIIRGKSTDNKILKEFYFFREAAPEVSDGINLQANNISTTTDGTVALSWSASAGADGYKIYYGTSSGNYDFYIDVGGVLSKEISGLTLDKNYYFSVTAYFATGAESGYSPEASIEVKDLAAPKAPTRLNLEKACDGEAVISWNKNIEDAAGYKVFYGSTQSGQYGSSADVKDANSATLKGLNNGTKYYLAVKAYDSSGNESVYSNEIAFTVIDSSSGQCFNFNDGLVLWQTFDAADISGNIAKDKSGKGNDGVIYGATSVAGKVGEALLFAANNNYVQLPPDSQGINIFFQENWSFAAWIKPTGSGDATQTIFNKIWHAPWVAYVPEDSETNQVNSINFGFRNSAGSFGWKMNSGADSIVPNQWNYVVLTSDGADYKMYINENFAGSIAYNSITNNNHPDFNLLGYRIGNTVESLNPDESFVGLIDEIRIYNKALSDTDIKALYDQSSNASIYSSMVSQWKFDEGAGNIAYDSVGNNNGILNGGSFWDNNGRVGGAMRFDGTKGSFVNCGDDPSLTFTDEITISYWYKRYGGNWSGYTEDKISKRNNYIVTGVGENTLVASIKNILDRYLSPPIFFADNTWVHQIHTYNAATGVGKSYKNGVLVGQKIYTAGPSPYKLDPANIPLTISDSLYTLNGVIDEVIIFSRVLSDPEAELLYKNYQ